MRVGALYPLNTLYTVSLLYCYILKDCQSASYIADEKQDVNYVFADIN